MNGGYFFFGCYSPQNQTHVCDCHHLIVLQNLFLNSLSFYMCVVVGGRGLVFDGIGEYNSKSDSGNELFVFDAENPTIFITLSALCQVSWITKR